jgi:hypothetical protein
MSICCPKWGTKLKADFHGHIKARHINSNKTDRAYILSIHGRYYNHPDATLIKNYNALVAEGRIGHYINEYNKGKGEMLLFDFYCLVELY